MYASVKQLLDATPVSMESLHKAQGRLPAHVYLPHATPPKFSVAKQRHPYVPPTHYWMSNKPQREFVYLLFSVVR